MKKKTGLIFIAILGACSVLYAADPAGGGTEAGTIGDMAKNLKANFTQIGSLIIATAQVAGAGFTVASIFKFKQHKDNPTQVQIGTPFALLAVGVLLMFIPGLFKTSSKSIYGKDMDMSKMFEGDITDDSGGSNP